MRRPQVLNATVLTLKTCCIKFNDSLAVSHQTTQLPSGIQIGTGVRVVSTEKEFTGGSLQITDQGLDLAINSRGFFQIQLPNGETGYTRNGAFQLNSEGQIVNSAGYLLEPNITVPENASNLTISIDGAVSATIFGNPNAQQLGNIQIADFVNPAGLQSQGGNIFTPTAASGDAQTGTAGLNGLGEILQGTLENSNVEVVEELVNMISTQRTYEMNSKVISTVDQMLQYISQNL
jgi:flagellar basal-body rod protein FlgG